MKRVFLWMVVMLTSFTFIVGCMQSNYIQNQQSYPLMQQMVDESLDEVLKAMGDFLPRGRFANDSRIAALERFVQGAKGGAYITSRFAAGESFTASLSKEDDLMIGSLFDDYPDFSHQVGQITARLDTAIENLPPINITAVDYDNQGNQIGKPYTIVSEYGAIELGVDTIPLAEYVFRSQFYDTPASRGFAGDWGYGVSYWPNKTVSYYFDQSLSEADKDWIDERIQEISDGTGVAFDKYDNTSWLQLKFYTGERYVRIKKAELGNTPAQVNGVGAKWLSTLSIDKETLTDKESEYSELIMSHEIGHILGLLHEHQRPDRDTYVFVKPPDNASSGEIKVNYGVVPYIQHAWWGQLFQSGAIPVSLTYDTPFDYNSAMIYGTRYRSGEMYGVWRKDGSNDIEGLLNKQLWGSENGNTYYTPWDIYTIKRIYGIPTNLPDYTP